MERHKCKLCTRTFSNGRALGGHMKAHLATLPLPPKAHHQHNHHQLGGGPTDSAAASSSSPSSGEEQEQEQEHEQEQEDKTRELEEKSLVYGLRENPKKSFRLADPEFSFTVDAGSVVVVQDRESETESRNPNPTRRRSKRNGKSNIGENHKQLFEIKKPKLKSTSWVESPAAEPEPVSSVSDTSSEEDVAMCLMMLSRDVWMKKNEEQDQEQVVKEESDEIKFSRIPGKYRCGKCKKVFRSHHALGGHKRICYGEVKNAGKIVINKKIFECPFCYKVFGSGQALGGHKRSHFLGSSTPTKTTMAAAAAAAAAASSAKFVNTQIDLNMPAPLEDDDFSVVSDA